LNIASGLVKFILLSANSFLAILLILSAYSSHIDPIDQTFPAFLGLSYPFILLFNLLFIVAWFLLKKQYMFISAIAILLSFPALSNFFQFNLPKSKSAESIKVMSYNVRLFDLYNWSENIDSRNKIFDQLGGQNADIYCFQEFYFTEEKGKFETRDTLITFLNAKNYREAYTHKMRGGQYFGIATFTRFPVVNSGDIVFENDDNNICLYTDVLINEDTVRIYNLHIASIRFSYDDYDFVENIDTKSESKELEIGARHIYHRLSSAFVKRSVQSKVIINHVNKSPYPVILCGDFNDSPNSYCYEQFSGILEDSFKEAGRGIGNTYIGAFPSFRIDYIFHTKQFEATNYITLPEEFSDHHAIVSEIKWKGEQ
jgi:endonuclease/exonuclease/phosphatase family metal-dependent hydrolase